MNMDDFWLFILENLDAAGAIGGYVSLSILGFALMSFIVKKRYGKLAKHLGPKWTHPIIGSFLGAIPGCGATIVVSSLYKNKQISFGGLFASFISTLGEGSFVLLGASNEADVPGNLQAYVLITIFGLVTGIIFGYFADILGFRFVPKNIMDDQMENQIEQSSQNTLSSKFIEKIGYYTILLMAIFLAPGSIMALWGGGIDEIADLTFMVTVCFTLVCLFFYFMNKFIYRIHESCCDQNDIRSSMKHAIVDVSMVVTYVFIGLLVSNFIIDDLIGEDKFNLWMESSAVYVVILLSAIIGVMPGCGGMIVVASAFLATDSFPMAALIAASIATSGDGIFPLFAENSKDGFFVSFIGLMIAIVVGFISLFLGF
ncbi:MAG: hypothetical protein CMP51_03980 [Flavobacteriales bacterium]|nr:hypothetical protein [Flavobacteriales bacterium]